MGSIGWTNEFSAKIAEHNLNTMSARLLLIHSWEKLAREANFQPGTMAALCPISLRSMQRFFDQNFGKTPTEWARELRCRRAREMVSSGWSNKAIAAELGYASASHLCHEFKKVYGFSPQSYSLRYERDKQKLVNNRASESRRFVAFRQ